MGHSQHWLRGFYTVTMTCVLAACSGDDNDQGSNGDNASSSSSSSSSGGSGGPTGNLDVIDGIEFPVDLESCPGISPIFSRGNIEFTWLEVPGATHYAVRLSKATNEDSQELDRYETMVERIQVEPSISTGERTVGIMYRLDAYALDGRTPKCVLAGVNMAGGGG